MGGRVSACGGVISALVGILLAQQASAQGYEYTYPTPPPQDQPPTPQPVEPEPKEKVSAHRGFQGGFNIGVPIWLDVDTSVVRPGADLHFFGGYDIGYAMFGIDLGAMWTPIDLNGAPGVPPGTSSGRSPLTRLYFAPEVRVQVPNPSPILPYLAATFDVNWWHFRETGIACNYWYCTQVNVFRFTPGFTAKLGIAFRIKRGAHIDLGAKYSLSGAGDFFTRREQWFTPYLGFFFR
ncbi:MAG: hypothetical protein JSV06_08910 [Myxococcales bacterium]|nr:MAG: hypothetical protein JSV06_08910 [Myxococcales bacterium]